MKFKRVLSVLMCFVLILSTLTFSAVSVDAETYGDFEYQILDDNTVEITGYTGEATDLVIPSEIDGKTVTSIGESAFEECYSLENITIPDSVTNIGDMAFVLCESLTSVTIPNSVTDIGEATFFYCYNLTSIVIPNSVTRIGMQVFEGCESLTSLTISDSVTYISNDAFENCNIKELIIADGSKKVTSTMVVCNSSLEKVTIPDSVTSIGQSVFWGCESLTNITIPNSVTSIGSNAFYSCSKLTSVTIPVSVTSIGKGAFGYYHNGHKVVTLDDFIIYGYKNSEAEKYANDNEIEFVSIGVAEQPTEPTTQPITHATEPTTKAPEVTTKGTEVTTTPTEPTTQPITHATEPTTKAPEVTTKGTEVTTKGTEVTTDVFEYQILGDNTIEITGYSGDATELEIPSEIDGKTVTSIGSYAFGWGINLVSVTIPDSVTSIKCNSFHGCSTLSNITIPDSVTSIGYDAFRGTAYYSDKSNWEDSVLYIGEFLIVGKDVYYDWESDKDIGTFAEGDYNIKPGTKVIAENAFQDCLSLVSVTIPDSVVTVGESSFQKCISLESIQFGKGIITIESMAFASCSSLTSVTIPDSVTTICNAAFQSCESLTDVTIGSNVVSIGDFAFNLCSSLTSITIPDSVKSIGYDAFFSCSDDLIIYGYTNSEAQLYAENQRIEFVSIGVAPERYTYTVLEDNTIEITGYIGESNELEIPTEIDGYTVTSIGEWALNWCSSLTSITIPDSVKSIGMGAFSDCKSLANITIPNSVTTLGGCVFEGCDSLTSVIIPDSITSIGYSEFAYCSSLKTVTIPDSVTSIGNYAFEDCTSLTSITIPESVTSIGSYAFGYCSSLTSITIPNSVTSIGNYAFEGCELLANITVDTNNLNYSSVDGVLFNEDKTELIQYPVGNERTTYAIPNSVTNVGYRAFGNCYSLISITIPNSVTSIGEDAFYGCLLLESVVIPDSVTSIGKYAFYYCVSLTNITIGDGVTTIGYDAFRATSYYNDKLNWEEEVLYIDNYLVAARCGEWEDIYDEETDEWEEIYIPSIKGDYTIKSGTKAIADYAFYDCTELTSVTIPNSVTNIGFEALGYYVCYDEDGEEYSVLVEDFVIYGYSNSEAQRYANDNGITFVALDGVPEEPTTQPTVASSTTTTKPTEPTTQPAVASSTTTTKPTESTTQPTVASSTTTTKPTEPTTQPTVASSTTTTKPTEPTTQPTVASSTTTTKPTESTTKPTTKPTTTQKPAEKPTVCVHTTVIKNANKATYFKMGYSGDKVCVKCGVTTAKGKAIKKLTLKEPTIKLIKGKKQFKVKYTKVKDATGFEVRYKLKGKWVKKSFNSKKTITKTIKKLKKGAYKVQVRSFVKQGKQKAYSNWSKSQTVKVK